MNDRVVNFHLPNTGQFSVAVDTAALTPPAQATRATNDRSSTGLDDLVCAFLSVCLQSDVGDDEFQSAHLPENVLIVVLGARGFGRVSGHLAPHNHHVRRRPQLADPKFLVFGDSVFVRDTLRGGT